MNPITSTAARQWPGQSGSATPPAAEWDRAARTQIARDRRLAEVLSDGSLVWLLDERFDAAHDTWTVNLLRADAMAGWRRQRYMYDAADDALYFWGEWPVSAAQVRALNLRALPRFCADTSPACFNPRVGSAPSLLAHGDHQRPPLGDDAIDEALEQSFPASDPPFWMPGTLL